MRSNNSNEDKTEKLKGTGNAIKRANKRYDWAKHISNGLIVGTLYWGGLVIIWVVCGFGFWGGISGFIFWFWLGA